MPRSGPPGLPESREGTMAPGTLVGQPPPRRPYHAGPTTQVLTEEGRGGRVLVASSVG